MRAPTNRCAFLGTVGGIALGGLVASGTAAARGDGNAPDGPVETERVSFFSTPDDPTEVPAGSWINHRFGWLDAYGESTPEDLAEYRDAVELTVSIDDDELADPDQYWGEPYQSEEDEWILPWSYVTPPTSVGTHEFHVEFYYPDGYGVDGEVREPGVREPWTGYYEVVPDR